MTDSLERLQIELDRTWKTPLTKQIKHMISHLQGLIAHPDYPNKKIILITEEYRDLLAEIYEKALYEIEKQEGKKC